MTLVTRGDANDSTERWVLAADAPARRMVGRIPWVGHLAVWLASPLLRAVLLALGALFVLGLGLTRLRRGRA